MLLITSRTLMRCNSEKGCAYTPSHSVDLLLAVAVYRYFIRDLCAPSQWGTSAALCGSALGWVNPIICNPE